MKNSESIRFSEILNDGLIFRNGEIRVTTVSGIDHHFEEFLTNLLIACFDHFGSFGSVGEILEFHSSQKFEMPCLYGAFIQASFLVASGM